MSFRGGEHYQQQREDAEGDQGGDHPEHHSGMIGGGAEVGER
jgi:hypothetical protein